MRNDRKTPNAIEILHRRYIGDNAERQESIEAERVHAQVARAIYDLRKEAGLTQKDLAKLIGTTQSVISRLEDADYEGHSFSMLLRISHALKRSLIIQIGSHTEKDAPFKVLVEVPRRSLSSFSSNYHKSKGLRPGQIAPQSGRYQQVGPRGGKGREVTVVKGDPLPPTPKEGITYDLIDSVKGENHIRNVSGSALVESTKNMSKKGKIIR